MKSKYFVKRLLIAIPTFLGITLLAYFISSLAPGSPLDALLADPRINAAELERRRIELGLDQNVLIQYWNWLKSLLQGNLGYSFGASRQSVNQMISERLGATMLLSGSALLFSILLSIPLGFLRRQNRIQFVII